MIAWSEDGWILWSDENNGSSSLVFGTSQAASVNDDKHLFVMLQSNSDDRDAEVATNSDGGVFCATKKTRAHECSSGRRSICERIMRRACGVLEVEDKKKVMVAGLVSCFMFFDFRDRMAGWLRERDVRRETDG